MTPENRRLNATREWALAEQSLAAAEHLRQGGFYAESIARAYYAVFHGARALLLTRELEPATHPGLRSEFARMFVHSGQFDSGLARTLGALQKEREDADYTRDVTWSEAQAQDALAGARAFNARIHQLLLESDCF